jgi:hypothetical protein
MRTSVTAFGIAMLTGAAVLAQAPAQQQPAATFRSTTRLIVQTVTVKDKDGNPIEGLTTKRSSSACRRLRSQRLAR